jgi:RND family efflux transporter MFP subunit
MLDTSPHDTTHLTHPPQYKRGKPGGGLKVAGMIAVIVALAIVVLGLMSRLKSEHDLKTWTADQAVPTITLAKVAGGGATTLVLPGSVQPFSSASIHARVPGYLKKWYVDIGANVKDGQLLAEIDTPDLDQQVTQARANLATAQANQKLSESTSKRWADLLASDAVSRQEADEKAGDLSARQSLSNAAKADLDRLLALENFKRITSPFGGVVTTRTTDVGALIGLDTALFTVADQHRMRVYVRVPQTSSAMVHAGQTAQLTAPEYPGQVFTAVVASDARAVDAQNGGLLTELQIDNASGMLKAGEYVQVSFNLPATGQGVVVPSTALLYRDNGPAVVLIGPDNKATIHPVKIAHDLGANIEIASGLTPQDKVADNPPENIATGDVVKIASPNAQPKASNAKG